jgi:hypothetical protein
MAQYSYSFDNMILTYLEKMMTSHINHYDWEYAIKKFLNNEEIAFISYINFTTISDYIYDDIYDESYLNSLPILLKYPPKIVLEDMIENANNLNDKENWLIFSENLWEYIHSNN